MAVAHHGTPYSLIGAAADATVAARPSGGSLGVVEFGSAVQPAQQQREIAMRRRLGRIAVLGSMAAAGLFAARPAHADDPAPREPTAAEQLMVELVNRTRLDPDREAARQGIGLNEGLPDGTLTPEAREPLAVNLLATDVALIHTKDLFAKFDDLPGDHRGSDGRDPTQRVNDAGADFFGDVAENNAWITQGSTRITASSSKVLHKNLFRDFLPNGFEVFGRGHRKVMLNGARNEIGVAVRGGDFGGRTAAITTYDMFSSSTLYITGVAIQDNIKSNGFYEIGEGLSGITITATPDGGGQAFATVTWRSGGYSLAVPAGTYDVVASGGGLARPVVFDDVVVSDRNVKVDVIVARAFDPPAPAGITITKALTKRTKDGIWNLVTKRATASFGILGFDEADLATFRVEIDGIALFGAADQATGKVKPKIDAALGQVRKVVIKDLAKNKVKLDLKKGTLALTIKSLPGFDPSDGSVRVAVFLNGIELRADVPGVAKGTKGNKFKLGPADGLVFRDG